MRHIYNTTFLPSEGNELALVEVIKGKVLPRLLAQDIDVEPILTRVFVSEEDGNGYSLQLIFPDEANYRRFMDNHRESIFNEIHTHMGENILHFSSLLKEIT